MRPLCHLALFLTAWLVPLFAADPPAARPLIWATASDRAPILAKIQTQPWAKSVFDAMKARVADSVAAHARDADAFLRELPFVPHPTDATRHPTFALIGGNMASTPEGRRSHNVQRFLHLGTDCVVLDFLTEEERYARCAADILHASVEALAQMPRNNASEQGGIVYPGDVLHEARAVGAQLPIIYDFLDPWLSRGAKVHNVAARAPVDFGFARAQQVFRAYARLIIEHGQTDSNHPVLEMPCLAFNALGIDTARPVALEPALGASPVSANHSFTLTRFTDTSGEGTKAEQQRLVGIVRTSPTTGYYGDVFRSRTAQPEQFHDYLYRNLGDALTLTAAGQPLALADTPDRFRPAAGTSWSRNRSFLWPGWHVFKSTRTSAPFANDVAAEFAATKLKPAPAAMRLFIPGAEGREYASALAPETKEAPSPYDKTPTPVLVIRRRGEAWTRPFAAIYEPSLDGGSFQSVGALARGGVFSGFKVVSRVAGRSVTQLVLVQPTADGEFADPALGLTFRGRYAVVTLDKRGAVVSLSLGDGTYLRCPARELTAARSAFADYTGAANAFPPNP